MFPEDIGWRSPDAVIKLYDSQSVPARDVVPTVPMTAEMLEFFTFKTGTTEISACLRKAIDSFNAQN